jgi:glutathione synthase/RimK-type ligase-like ATP-grasp enzyme
MDVAVLTFKGLPQLYPLDAPLVPALRERGLDARPVIWDDPEVDWSRVGAAVVRNVWDSHLRRDEFVAWADRVAQVTRLFNPADVLRWNTHKGYLKSLEARGLPLTPTVWVPPGGTLDVAAVARERGWDAVVLKPAVAAGGLKVGIFRRDAWHDASAKVAELSQEGDVMVQPYLTAFETEGERAYIFFNGVFSHAVRRPPMLSTATRAFTEPHAFTPQDAAELKVAHDVMEACGGAKLLYARVDVATDNAGRTRLQEVELTEPCLFLSLDAGAPGRMAEAVIARL